MLSRAIYRKQRGRRWITFLAVAGLVASTFFVAATAFAVHDEGLFELDTTNSAAVCGSGAGAAPCGNANVADDPAGGADDWANVYKSFSGTGTAGEDHAFGRAFITDPVAAAENSFYTGGGSKDERDIPSWLFATSNDVVPDKDDIAHAFAAAYQKSGDTFVYFGVDRYDNNGDAETGFWFFKNKVSLGANGAFTGVHSTGDVLVLANWGGSNPVGDITVYDWVGGKNPLRLVADNLAADCATVGANDNFCAAVNRQTVSQPWSFADKAGSSTIRPLELFEAGINITELFGQDRCFASFLAATRSSHSTTAQLKDFALGSFEQCGAAISISPSGVNEVDGTHTFTVHVTKSVGGVQTGVAGVKPTVTLTASGGAAVANKVDNCATTGTDAGGDCTVTFTSGSAGVVTGHASATVTIGTDSFPVETDGQAPNSGDAVKRFVDANVTIAETAVNEVGNQHVFTITTTAFPAGTTASLTSITADVSPTPGTISDTCSSPTGSGNTRSCTVTINSATAGLFTANATAIWSFTGTGSPSTATVTRSTSGDSGPGGSGAATKRFVDAWITIGPDGTNTVGDPHTFTVTVKQNDGGGGGFVNVADGTTPTVTLTSTNGAARQISSNTCSTTGTVSGQCSVTFTSPTAGTVTGHASVSLTINGEPVVRETDGVGNNSDDAVKTFVAGSIKWTKVDNAGNLQGGATFTVCKTDNYNLSTDLFDDVDPDLCFDVTDNSAPDVDADNGEFEITGLSLGRYTVKEKTAPAGFVPDPDTETVDLVPGDSSKTIATDYVNTREVLKITGFGYTNAAAGTPTSGVVSGTTVFTVDLHNYGSAAATLTNSSLVVSAANKTAGTLTCNGTGTDGLTLALTGIVAVNANAGPFSLTCTYTNLNDGAQVIADLVVKSTTNGLEREASGSPARIRFTVQAD